jgi:hypothetical protein
MNSLYGILVAAEFDSEKNRTGIQRQIRQIW